MTHTQADDVGKWAGAGKDACATIIISFRRIKQWGGRPRLALHSAFTIQHSPLCFTTSTVVPRGPWLGA